MNKLLIFAIGITCGFYFGYFNCSIKGYYKGYYSGFIDGYNIQSDFKIELQKEIIELRKLVPKPIHTIW